MKLAMLTASCDEAEKEEGFIYDWISALSMQVDELVVFILKKPKLKPKLSNTKFYILDQPTKIQKVLFLFTTLYKEHKQTNFDGIFTHIFDFLGIAGGIWGKIFRVKSLMWHAGGIKLKKWSALDFAFKLNDEIVTCSEIEKKRYQRFYKLNKPIHVLGHAIDINRFKSKKITQKKSFNIGYVCRATSPKNIETLIKASAFAKSNISIQVILVLSRLNENRTYVKKIKRMIKEHKTNKINFKIIEDMNFIDIPSFYHTLNLYAHPSLMQSIDKAGLEAASSGIPVLLSRSGYSEICLDFPDILFDPNDIKKLANKITQNIRNYDVISKHQTKFQKYVRNTYSTEIFMKKIVQLF